MLILEKPWTRQPQGSYSIAPKYRRNLLQGFVAQSILDVNGLFPFTVIPRDVNYSEFGRAIPYTGSGYAAAPTVAGTDPWTMIVYLSPRSDGNLAVVTHAEAPGNSVRDRAIQIRAGGTVAAYINDGVEKVVTTSASVLTTGSPTLIGASCGGGVLRIFAGNQTNTIAVGNTGFNGYTTPELVIGYGGGPASIGGVLTLTSDTNIFYLLKYRGEAWSLGQFAELALNPWQLFAPQQIYIPTPAAASALPTLSASTYVPGSITATGVTGRVTATEA